MEQLFPNGVWFYAAGGALTGLGIGMIYLLTGRVAGVSSFLSAVQSWWSRRAYFQQPERLEERRWKSVLVVGLIAGAVIHTLTLGDVFITEVQWWRLLLGGVAVGFGTRLARGCTSGHGICGISAWSVPSVASTITFMAVAVGTAWLMQAMGVSP